MRYPPLTRLIPELKNLDHDAKEAYWTGYHKKWRPRDSRNRSLVYHEAVRAGRDAREMGKG